MKKVLACLIIALMCSSVFAHAKPLHHKHYSWEGKKRKHRRHLIGKHLTRPRHRNATVHAHSSHSQTTQAQPSQKTTHGHGTLQQDRNTIKHAH